MMWAYLTGALVGLGLYLLVRMFIKPSANVLSTIARIDAGRSGYTSAATASAAGERVLGGVDKARETLGRRLEHPVDELMNGLGSDCVGIVLPDQQPGERRDGIGSGAGGVGDGHAEVVRHVGGGARGGRRH